MQTCSICQVQNKDGHIYCISCGGDLPCEARTAGVALAPFPDNVDPEQTRDIAPFPDNADPEQTRDAAPFPDDVDPEQTRDAAAFPDEVEPECPGRDRPHVPPGMHDEARCCDMCGEKLPEHATFCGMCGCSVNRS